MKYFIGLDLGQSYDPSAVAVVEEERGVLVVRYLERAPLGTPYPQIVEWMRQMVGVPPLRGRCGLVVDGTGVGAPVVDMLRAGRLGCEITDVRITGGDRENSNGSEWNAPQRHVPKMDLIAGLQVAMGNGELKIAAGMAETPTLVRELLDMRMHYGSRGRMRLGADGFGEHDDLVIALALAVWRARRKPLPMNGLGGGRLF